MALTFEEIDEKGDEFKNGDAFSKSTPRKKPETTRNFEAFFENNVSGVYIYLWRHRFQPTTSWISARF